MNTDAAIRHRLWVVLIVYETLVIAIVAGAGLNIALMGGGSIAMVGPLFLISCAEALRIPLSAMATRLRWPANCSRPALLAIATVSAEGIAIAVEAFLQNRVVDIMRANAAVDRAQRAVDRIADERKHADAAIASLDAQVAALAQVHAPPPAASNRTCTWKGQRVSCSSDAAATSAYREALRAYDSRLASLSSQRDAARSKNRRPRPRQRPPDALGEAKQAFEEKADQSPVWRLTAAVFGESVSDVTPAQFSRVKGFVTATLAIGFATLSMAVTIIVHAKLRSEAPASWRAPSGRWSRRRRKTLRRLTETIKFQDRVIIRWIPFDPKSGLRIKPDGEPGEVISPTWAQKS